jgi:carbamoyl-phosphate synthase large subunit
MNILLTCAGRRNYLVQYFAEALGSAGKVFAADCNPNAPALHEADKGFVVPAIDQPDYVERILSLCRDNQVSLLVPLNDFELPLLSRHKSRFDDIDTTLLISSPTIIDTCFDKWRTAEFLKSAGIEGPNTYLTSVDVQSAICSGDLVLPFILKPRWGSASIGVETIFEDEDIEPTCRLAAKRIKRSNFADPSAEDPDALLIYQERLNGQEYGLDVINDLSGRYLFTFVRRKLAMRAGETDHAVAIRNSRLEALGERIGRSLGHVGILDCDVFDCDGELSVLEMNARFGGGYPFTHTAGANLPAILIALVKGEAPPPDAFAIRDHTIMSKCDRIVIKERPSPMR